MLNSTTSVKKQTRDSSSISDNNTNQHHNNNDDDDDRDSFISKTSSYLKRNMKIKTVRRAINFIILMSLAYYLPNSNNSLGTLFAKFDNMTEVCSQMLIERSFLGVESA